MARRDETPAMAPHEVSALRERLGMTREAVAAEIGRTELEVSAWESGRIPVDRLAARQLARAAAVREHEAAIDAAGLARCAWVAEHPARTEDFESAHKHEDALQAHLRSCPVCTARHRWARKNLPPLPREPITGGVDGLIEEVLRRIRALPPWVRPGVYGVIFGLATSVLLIVTILLGNGADEAFNAVAFSDALKVFGIITIMGGAGGVAYGIVRPALRPMEMLGDYLTGVCCVLVSLLAAAPLMDGGFEWTDPFNWGGMLFTSVILGAIVGFLLRNDR